MEGKLIKTEVNYILENDKGVIIASTSLKKKGLSLSIKNCEAIANGYDLEELINRAFDNMGYHSTVTPYEEKQFKLGYRIAFREALEILGDKKFSEQDMYKMFIYGHSIDTAKKHLKELEDKPIDEFFNEFIQSLQKNEWDVEIEMEGPLVYPANLPKEGEERPDYRPKLDENKCLILKRK